jgi:hypothetical protein
MAPSVAGRVQVFVTRYNNPEDSAGRWAIRVDGKEIEGLSEYTAWYRRSSLRTVSNAAADAEALQAAEGSHDLQQFYRALQEYLNLSVDEALRRDDAIIRALVFLDVRLGKRRLRLLRDTPCRSRLEAACLALRCSAEGISEPNTLEPEPRRFGRRK